MADVNSLDQSDREHTNEVIFVTCFSVVGGLFGFIYYVASAFVLGALESTFDLPSELTYGQQAGLISLPLCTLIAAGIGFAIAVGFARTPIVAGIICFLIGILGGLTIRSIWLSQIASYGRDFSEIVLYYPPMAMCGCAVAVALLIWIVRIVRCWKAKCT